MKEKVLDATGDSQQPWESNGLARRVYLSGQIKPAATLPPPSAAPSQTAELARPAPMKCIEALVAGEQRCLKPKETFKECADCPEMVVAPPGEFAMGSNDFESASPQHKVTIVRPFAVGKFEVTFAEWDACLAAGGCKHKPAANWGRGRDPVMNVSWEDVTKDYLPWLNKKLGLAPDQGYRLLTEAEWEYAARAGTTGTFSFEGKISTDKANYNGIDGFGVQTGVNRGRTVVVDEPSFPANPWGLRQVHGNVWEWVQDCYKEGYADAPADGSAMTSGECKFISVRGGSWLDGPEHLRSANRGLTIDVRHHGIGFRAARTLTP